MVYVYEYHRTKLNRMLDCVYNDILEAVKNRQNTLELSGASYPDISKCYNAVFFDHPELFWMSHQCNAQISQSLLGSSVALIFEYIYSVQECLAIKRKAAALAAQVKGKDEEDTENNIVDLIVRSTTYEIEPTYNQNMASALYYKKAQCSGIAKAVKYLCDCNNIRCIFVDGSIKIQGGGPHAWNLIAIKGNFYHLDVTSILGSNPAVTGHLFKPFFNLTDREISSSHVWDTSNFPMCSKIYDQPKQSNYSQSNVYAYQCDTFRFTPTPTKTFNQNQSTNGIIKISTLAQLRTFIESQYKASKREVVFVLTLSSSPEERMKFIRNATKMVMEKLDITVQIGVTIVGDINTIKFNQT